MATPRQIKEIDIKDYPAYQNLLCHHENCAVMSADWDSYTDHQKIEHDNVLAADKVSINYLLFDSSNHN